MPFTRRKIIVAISLILALLLTWLSIQSTSEKEIDPTKSKFSHLKTFLPLSRGPNSPSTNTLYDLQTKQRMVFLAGPHKTSSSSIQTNFLEWITTPPTSQSSFENWTWPLPVEMYSSHNCTLAKPKSFYVYIEALKEQNSHGRCIRKIYSASELQYLYQEVILQEWKTGKNVLIATEAMDYIGTNLPALKKKDVLGKLLQGMPWNFANDETITGSQDDITVVISYRSPRIKHLKSLWHQCCIEMSFEEYLTQRLRTRMDPLRALDSLFLTGIFLNRGLKVVLLDMEGVLEQGYDMSSVIACDILQVDCTQKKTVVGITQELKMKNVRSDSNLGNVTEIQMRDMDESIRKYDCRFRHLMGHKNLTIMYGTNLESILEECDSLNTKYHVQSREDLVNSIIKIASTSE